MPFDDILIRLGEFGKYQRIQYTFACIVSLLSGAQSIVAVYLYYVPPHRCELPSSVWPNDTWSSSNVIHTNLIRNFYPKDSLQQIDQCSIYNITGSDVEELLRGANLSGNVYPKVQCSKWVFDNSQMKETYITQYNLVCSEGFYGALFKSIYLGGMLAGAPFFGWLADVIGRKKTLMIGILLSLISYTGISFMNNTIGMLVLRCISGATVSALFPCVFVLGMELVGPNRRLDAGMIIEYVFAAGICIMAGVAALIQQWMWINISVTIPLVLLFSLWWLMPESPRWLVSKNRRKEAMDILQRAAKINKVDLPEDCLDESENEANKPRGTIIDVIKSKILLLRSLNMCYQWMVVAMVYYGLSLSTGNLPGSIYFNSFLFGLVEIPAYAFGHLTLNRFGRKKTYFLSILVGGIFCTSNILLVYFAADVGWAFIVVGMIGKLFITSGFGIIYIWTSELYPTSVRSVGVGTSSMFARVGSMLGPQITDNLVPIVGGKFGEALPLLIFGIASLVAAGLSLLIPETLGQKLPETIEDGENFGRK